MTTWTRAKRYCLCGGCGRRIDVGEPVFEIVPMRVKWPMVRCTACAWSSVPPDLPPLIARHDTTKRLMSLAAVATRTVQDFRQRQVGEDDE
jgi:hypothetical protein